MNKFQEKIKKFAEERDWTQFHTHKDLLLGIVEEIGEIRNIIKWEQDIEKIKKAIDEHKEELKDHIGDLYWFLALLANNSNIDLDEAISEVINKNELRFPINDTKSKHTNIYLGGKDKNYN